MTENNHTTSRLFVALTLPDPVRNALAALATPLPGVAWTTPTQLHLTLRFLGEIPRDRIELITARMAAIRVAPFILPVEGLGTLPVNRPPRILWAGVGRGHPRLFQLRQRLDDALLAAGVQLDVRIFQPHATLARCTENAGPAVDRWRRVHRDFGAPPFRVEAMDLFSSTLQSSGPVHTLKQHFPLTEV